MIVVVVVLLYYFRMQQLTFLKHEIATSYKSFSHIIISSLQVACVVCALPQIQEPKKVDTFLRFKINANAESSSGTGNGERRSQTVNLKQTKTFHVFSIRYNLQTCTFLVSCHIQGFLVRPFFYSGSSLSLSWLIGFSVSQHIQTTL